MGQQQLILLVLATVIVGLAIIVGIRAFNENAIKSNLDTITQDVVRMANDAQAWKQKAAPFGGQDPASSGCTQTIPGICDDNDFTGLSDLAQLGYATTTGIYTNLNGAFTITSAGSATGVQISGYSGRYNNCVLVTVDGISDVDIDNTNVILNGSPNAASQAGSGAAP